MRTYFRDKKMKKHTVFTGEGAYVTAESLYPHSDTLVRLTTQRPTQNTQSDTTATAVLRKINYPPTFFGHRI